MRSRLLAVSSFVWSCGHDRHDDSPESARAKAPAPSTSAPNPLVSRPSAARRVTVETLAVPGDQPAFALRGVKAGARAVGVFLHGWCGHGLGYLQAFEFAAAEAGHFLALQGDLHCGNGPFRAWSGDPEAIDRRIDAALHAYLGSAVSGEVLLGGSSQGVDRVAALARRFPAKYRRLILMSGPAEISPAGLSALEGAYFLAGQNENVWPTKLSVERFRRAGVRAEFQAIPNAGHADFGGQGNPLMLQAFRFLGVLP